MRGRLIVHRLGESGEVSDILRKALAEAALVPDVGRQAWILRHAFDAILRGTDDEEDNDDDLEDEGDGEG